MAGKVPWWTVSAFSCLIGRESTYSWCRPVTYLESASERSALAALPLDSSLKNVPLERVISRLKTERGQADGGVVMGTGQTVLLAILVVERTPDEALAQSIHSIALQSHPGVRCVVIP